MMSRLPRLGGDAGDVGEPDESFDTNRGTYGEHEPMTVAFCDDRVQWNQRFLDPADASALAKRKPVWFAGTWLERQVQLRAQLRFVFEDQARELLGDGLQPGHRILWRPRPQERALTELRIGREQLTHAAG